MTASQLYAGGLIGNRLSDVACVLPYSHPYSTTGDYSQSLTRLIQLTLYNYSYNLKLPLKILYGYHNCHL